MYHYRRFRSFSFVFPCAKIGARRALRLSPSGSRVLNHENCLVVGGHITLSFHIGIYGIYIYIT